MFRNLSCLRRNKTSYVFIITADKCGYMKFIILFSTLDFIYIKKKTKQLPNEFNTHGKFYLCTQCRGVPVLSGVLLHSLL